jgi:hypothetical protein
MEKRRRLFFSQEFPDLGGDGGLVARAKICWVSHSHKKTLSHEQVANLRQRAAAGDQKAVLAREFGISRKTLYQYLRTNEAPAR